MSTLAIDYKLIQASGDAIKAFVDGLGSYKSLGLEILAKHGIPDPQPGHWYTFQDSLNAYKELGDKLGNATLFSVGEKIPATAVFPPEIDSIEKALASIDVAYHMNHSIDGKPMFDPSTGKMEEGIGHYNFKLINEGEAEITCDNPYPTAFDEGIIFAMAQRFNEASFVRLVEERSTRSKGGNEDVYLVQWF